MEITLAATTSGRLRPGSTLLIPVGSTEQHGRHLPLDTDTEVAMAVAESAAKVLRRRRVNVVVAPAVPYGLASEDNSPAGTISVGAATLRAVLVELARSARAWADRVVFVTGHPGSATVVEQAVAQLSACDGTGFSTVSLHEELAVHPTRARTSLMLRLRPWEVRAQRRTAAGVPSDAGCQGTADEGLEVLDLMTWRVVRAVAGG